MAGGGVMGYGDEILAAGEAQAWFDRTGDRSCIVDLQGRHRWHPIWEGNPVIVRPGQDRPGDHVLLNAPHHRPYLRSITQEQGWIFNTAYRARDYAPKIYLTDEERKVGQIVADTAPKFILVEPFTKHANLRWPYGHWDLLVKRLQGDGHVIVQHTHDYSTGLENVMQIQATFREACAIAERAQLYIRSESGMCHAAAALGVPQLTLWGGCMDWDVLGGLPRQVGLVATDPQSPCGNWQYCPHCARIMERSLTVDLVYHTAREILRGLR